MSSSGTFSKHTCLTHESHNNQNTQTAMQLSEMKEAIERLEIEFTVGSQKEEKRITNLWSKVEHLLAPSETEFSIRTKWGQTVLSLTCHVLSADDRWSEIRKLLDADGLLEHATVWKHADELEGRIKVHP